MPISRAERMQDDMLHQVDAARGLPITHAESGEVVAMALTPRTPSGDAGTEWGMLERAVLAMEARDWPALIVAVSRATLRAPSLAYRLRDLMDQHDVPCDRLWLELPSSDAVLQSAGIVRVLAARHRVGCHMEIGNAFDERGVLPELAAAGASFAWLQPGDRQSIADDLSALIAGRSLIRRSRVHGIEIIGPAELSPDLVPPDAA